MSRRIRLPAVLFSVPEIDSTSPATPLARSIRPALLKASRLVKLADSSVVEVAKVTIPLAALLNTSLPPPKSFTPATSNRPLLFSVSAPPAKPTRPRIVPLLLIVAAPD